MSIRRAPVTAGAYNVVMPRLRFTIRDVLEFTTATALMVGTIHLLVVFGEPFFLLLILLFVLGSPVVIWLLVRHYRKHLKETAERFYKKRVEILAQFDARRRAR